jgi:hypothetical protein
LKIPGFPTPPFLLLSRLTGSALARLTTISLWFAAFALSLSVSALRLDLGPVIGSCLHFILSIAALLSPFLIG